jgi:hypothetical protein
MGCREDIADPKNALVDVETADAAYGTVAPKLFVWAKKLHWICALRAEYLPAKRIGRRMVLRTAPKGYLGRLGSAKTRQPSRCRDLRSRPHARPR